MAVRQPRVPDARAMPEIEVAMRQIDRLVPLVGAPVTVTTTRTTPNELHNWDLIAPALLFSATSCLVSLRWLAEAPVPRRDEDAFVLLRRIYEHVVIFAWIAIDPNTNAPQWVAADYEQRLRANTDLVSLAVPGLGLTQESRDVYQAFLRQHRPMPPLPTAADHADQYWSTRIEDHGTFPRAPGEAPTGRWSLRKMYTAVYRPASAKAHPTPRGLYDFVWPGGAADTFVIANNMDYPVNRYAYTMAPLLFTTMLLIAEHVLGRPSSADVMAVFQGAA